MALSERGVRPGELRQALLTLQASARSQDVLLADLSQRVEASATTMDRQLRMAEVDVAALRSRVSVLEGCWSDATAGASKALAEVAALKQSIQACRAQVPLPGRAGSVQSSPRRASPAARTNEAESQTAAPSPAPPGPGAAAAGLASALEERLVKLEIQSRSCIDFEEKASALRSEVTSALHAARALTTRSLAAMEERVWSLGEAHRNLEAQVSSITASILGCGHEQQRLASDAAKIRGELDEMEKSLDHQVQDLQRAHGKTEEELGQRLAEEHRLRKEAQELLSAKLEDQLASMTDRQQHQVAELGRLSRELAAEAAAASKGDVEALREELDAWRQRFEERLQLGQSRTAKEIGEQRGRLESRLQQLEETCHPAALAGSELGSWLHGCILEVREAQACLRQTFESKFSGVLRCLTALYARLGLSVREALASLEGAPVSPEVGRRAPVSG